MAESQAVSLPTDQVAIPVKIDQTTAGTTNKVYIGTDGTVTANAGTGTMNVSVQNASLTVAGPLTDTQLRATAVPVSLTSLPSLAAGSAVIGSIANATFASTQSGTWNVGLSAGSNTIGTVAGTGNFTVIQGTATNLKTQAEVYQGGVAVSSSAPLAVSLSASTSGGAIPISGAPVDANGTMKEISATAGQVYGWYFYNPNTAAAYVRFYDAVPTPSIGGSGEKYVLTIPPVSGANAFGVGIRHDFGIYIAVTTARNVATGMGTPIDYNLFIKNL